MMLEHIIALAQTHWAGQKEHYVYMVCIEAHSITFRIEVNASSISLHSQLISLKFFTLVEIKIHPGDSDDSDQMNIIGGKIFTYCDMYRVSKLYYISVWRKYVVRNTTDASIISGSSRIIDLKRHNKTPFLLIRAIYKEIGWNENCDTLPITYFLSIFCICNADFIGLS